MLLHTLLHQFDPNISLDGIPDSKVTGICEDTRRLRPGELFVARSGTREDGARFLEDARIRGAVAAVVGAIGDNSLLPQIVVVSPNRAASVLANIFHGRPSDVVRVLGVTGTNGKTTTAYLFDTFSANSNARAGWWAPSRLTMDARPARRR